MEIIPHDHALLQEELYVIEMSDLIMFPIFNIVTSLRKLIEKISKIPKSSQLEVLHFIKR